MWSVDLTRLSTRRDDYEEMEQSSQGKYDNFVKAINGGMSPQDAARDIGSASGSNLEKLHGEEVGGYTLMSIRLSQRDRATFYIIQSTETVVIHSVGSHYKNIRRKHG